MQRIFSILLAIATALALVACGGGGGGGDNNSSPTSSSSSSTSPSSASISFVPSSVNLTTLPGGSSSITKVTLSIANFTPTSIVITTPSGNAQPSWAKIILYKQQGYAEIYANASGLTAGTYETTIRVVASDASGTSVTRDLPITLTVGTQTTGSLTLTPASVSLATPAGSTSNVIRVNFTGTNFAGARKTSIFIPASAYSWLGKTALPSMSYIDISANTSSLSAGTYETVLTIEVTDANGKVLSGLLPVKLTVTGSPSSTPVSWNVYNGDLAPDESNSLTLNSGAKTSFSRTGVTTGGITATGGIATLDTTPNTPTDNVQYKFDLPYSSQYPKKMTFAARVKAESISTALRALSIEANFAESAATPATSAGRVKLAIWGDEGISTWQGLTVERCDAQQDSAGITTREICKTNSGVIADIREYHVYQVSITLTEAKKGYLRVYVDGNETPVVTYGSAANPLPFRDAAGDGASYIHFGDMNSQAHKSYIDWLIWTQDGAFSPFQLKGKLPANIGTIPVSYQ